MSIQPLDVLLFIGGLVVLMAGAEALVRGAVKLASATGMGQLTIGLTVVAFGTSAPEAAVSIRAAITGNPGIALGNVVGSNIANVLLILGVAAIICPIPIRATLIKRDTAFMVAVSLVVLGLAALGRVTRWEGLLLFLALCAYTAVLVVRSRKQEMLACDSSGPDNRPARSTAKIVSGSALSLGGLAGLVLGAHFMVTGAVAMASALGMSELVVGLTMVALGTSLPELAASVAASVKGHSEIAVGNVVGSNLFNLLMVLGLSAAAAPGGMPVSPDALHTDLTVMAASAFICLPFFLTGMRLSRGEGAFLLLSYVFYVSVRILAAAG
ncbi:MAG: calcium/sodium antiporter [Thermodesulfobacteriota bacterium]